MMHAAVAYSHHPTGYPSFLSYAPTAQRKSDYGMSLHHPHHYLNDSIGANTSSSSPSSNNSSAHLLSYSGYSTGLDLSSHTNNLKRPRSDIDDDENNNINNHNEDSQTSASPSTSVLGDITSATNGQKMYQHLKHDYSQNELCPSLPFKKRARAVPPEQKDSAYFEKRARNNESAKRSRDARRQKEQQTQDRLNCLEHENSRLLMENQALRYQLSQLHALCGVSSKPLQ
ncbi:unnamed protein product [Rotaria socialis]|uniref:BZIP domain-containing protein n=1 Tax=Rotaria socialis TaxID=392032 RepID=A0A820RTW0_9BILA|nr:unnamed protein product [Rotaria socialis]CAF3194254.1 unnamed protein product [Rotaria socialis]CAF3359334.1 unnamed protein product [Rotaria socialis]CAF3461477.1 unnamed protein product [Rotaria socialis]CAF3491865.1 unnamed protein product [Rotaria socialis]